jgi:hypothetical protein
MTSRLSQTFSPRTVRVHNCSVKQNLTATPNSIYKTPKSEIAENLIELETPAPKKSMHLIDLTTPHPQKTPVRTPSRRLVNISATSTPNTSVKSVVDSGLTPKSSTKSISMRNNTLLKSAIKNSTLKKETPGKVATPKRQETPKPTSVRGKISFNSTPVSSQSFDSSVITVDDSEESAVSQIVLDETVLEQENTKLKPQKNVTVTREKIISELKTPRGLRKLFSTPAKEPKNDLSNLEGVQELMLTPVVSKEKVVVIQDEKISTLISSVAPKTPQVAEASINQTAEMEKLEILTSTPSKTPVTSNENQQNLTISDGFEKVVSIEKSIAKEDEINITAGEKSAILSKTPSKTSNLSEEDQVSNVLNDTYEIHSTSTELGDASNLSSSEMENNKNVENIESCEISGMPECVNHHLTDQEFQQKKENLMKWIEDERALMNKGEQSFEGNPVNQVLSSRFSNVTPNDSAITIPEPVNTGTPKVSILEIQILKKQSIGSPKVAALVRSPVSRLSLTHNTEIVANYSLSSPKNLNNEIPKSLRSTRKRIGNALTYLHNTSNLQDVCSDNNDTLNASSADAEPTSKTVLMESEAEEQNILSLDDQPKQNVPLDSEVIEAFPTNYIEFVSKEENEYEPEEDIYEIDEIESDHEENANADVAEIDNLEFTGVEYLEDEDVESENATLFSDTEQSRIEINISDILKSEEENSLKSEFCIKIKRNFQNLSKITHCF